MSDIPQIRIVHPVPEPSDGEEPFCPVCGADVRGPEISPQRHYGGKTHISRLLGLELQGHYDGTAQWVCPDCYATWPRVGIPLTPDMQEAIALDLAQLNTRPPDRLTALAEGA
jgi:hypothetical protein